MTETTCPLTANHGQMFGYCVRCGWRGLTRQQEELQRLRAEVASLRNENAALRIGRSFWKDDREAPMMGLD